MAAQKKAKAPEPAGESAPMWIVSFADLVTLLMSFFVVLYALKQGGPKQQLDTAAAIKATFDPSYTPPIDSPSEFDQAIRRMKALPGPPFANNGGEQSKPNDGAQGSSPNVETIRPGNQIVTGTKVTFALNDTKLDAASREVIHQIADKVKGLNNVLMIKGHVSADEVPLRPDDPNGMGLSYQRACLVAEELVKLGIDRRVLRPVACGPFEPIKTGIYDTAGLRINRRAEVFTTDYTAADYSPISTVPATTTQKDPEPKSATAAPTPGHAD